MTLLEVNTRSVIYDEVQPSVDDSVREVEVSRREFERKSRLLQERAEFSGSSPVFCRVEEDEMKKKRLGERVRTFKCYTHKFGCLVVKMTERRDVCYVAMSGSPTKLKTGQNIAQCATAESFYRMTTEGMRYLQRDMKLTIKESFFTESEKQKIRAGDVNMYSVGFACYALTFKTKESRNRCMLDLSNLATSRSHSDDRTVQLTRMIKPDLSATLVGLPEEIGFSGGDTEDFPSVRFLLSDNHGKYVSQTFYLKDVEVRDKYDIENKTGKSFSTNSNTYDNLTEDEKNFISRSIRVDTVFYKDEMRKWLNQPNASVVKLRDIQKLFDDPTFVRRLVTAATREMGIVHLIASPTPSMIEEMFEDRTIPATLRTKLKTWWNSKDVLTKGGLKKANVIRPAFTDFAPEDRNWLWSNKLVDVDSAPKFYIDLRDIQINLKSDLDLIRRRDRFALHIAGYLKERPDYDPKTDPVASRVESRQRKMLGYSFLNPFLTMERSRDIARAQISHSKEPK
jgi:hypothetical protein